MTHDDFHLQMNAYLAGGLTDAERAALSAHAASCPACAAALEQAEAADRELDELFAAARPDGGLEDRVIGRLRAVRSRPPMTLHPMVRRAAVGVAATILLGGVGFAVTQAERQNGSSLFSFLDPASRDAESARVPVASNLRQLIRDNRASRAGFVDDLSDVATPAEMADRFARGITVTPESGAAAVPALALPALSPSGTTTSYGRRSVVMNDSDFKPDANRPAARAAGEVPSEDVRLMREVDEKEMAGRHIVAGGASFGVEVAGDEATRGEVRTGREVAPAAGETLESVEDLTASAAALSKKNVEAGDAMLGTRLYATQPGVRFGDTTVAGKAVQERLGYLSVDARAAWGVNGTAEAAGDANRFRPADGNAVPEYADGFGKRLADNAGNNYWHARFADGHANWDKPAGAAGDGNAPAEVEKLAEAKKEPADAKGTTAAGLGDVTVAASADDNDSDFFSPGDLAGATEGKVQENRAKDPAAAAGNSYEEAERALGRTPDAGVELQVAQVDPAGAPDGQGQPAPDAPKPAAAPVEPVQQPAVDAVRSQAQKAAEEARQARLVAQADRKIIRNGDMSFEVEGYDSAVVQINKIAAEEGGFVATTESEKLPNGKVKGSVIVRVPPDRLDTLVLKLRGLGDLKNSRISAQDVTKQFTDLAAQLKAAQTMEKRLLQLIDSGKGEVKDLIEAEKQLGTWRERIETLTGEINYYSNLVSLSTLTVSLMERDIRQSALLSESEQVNMGIEATDVEQARGEAIKAIADAKGRIVESDLKTHDAGQYAATITAEVAPDAAGPVIDRLKQIGRVSRLEVQRRLATAEGAPPAPGARLERKDTRLQLSIYNLANVAPRNTTTLNLAAEDVEKAYRAILEQVGASGGRVVNSQLTKPTPEQTTGTVVFEAPADVADVLLGAVRGAGEVMRLDSTTNPDTQNSTDAKRGFSVQIQSLATVPPRESTTLRVAARDVAAAFNALREAVRSAGGRILTSQLAEQEGGSANVTGQLDFEVRRADYAAVEPALGTAGVVLSRNVSRSSDAQNTVDSKVLLQVALVDERTVPPRETVTLSLAVDDVAAKYEALLNALREVGGSGARVLVSSINQQDPNNTTATVEFDVRREDRAAVDKALADAGVVYGRTVARPAEGQPALDEKLRLSVTLHDVDNLAPRETTTLGLEVPSDVYATVNSIEAQAIALGGRKVDSDWAQDASGRNVARVVVDVPLAKAPELLDRAQRAGLVLTVQREQNPSAPEGTFSRARLSVTVATTDPILQRDQGLAASIKSGLSTSVYWLLESVKLIVIGLCLVAPWAIILWVVLRFTRRARERRRRGVTGSTPPGGGPAATPAV